MRDEKDKKRRNAGDVPRFVTVLLLVTPLAYLVMGYGFPTSLGKSSHGVVVHADGAPASGAVAISGFSKEYASAKIAVPVPKVRTRRCSIDRSVQCCTPKPASDHCPACFSTLRAGRAQHY